LLASAPTPVSQQQLSNARDSIDGELVQLRASIAGLASNPSAVSPEALASLHMAFDRELQLVRAQMARLASSEVLDGELSKLRTELARVISTSQGQSEEIRTEIHSLIEGELSKLRTELVRVGSTSAAASQELKVWVKAETQDFAARALKDAKAYTDEATIGLFDEAEEKLEELAGRIDRLQGLGTRLSKAEAALESVNKVANVEETAMMEKLRDDEKANTVKELEQVLDEARKYADGRFEKVMLQIKEVLEVSRACVMFLTRRDPRLSQPSPNTNPTAEMKEPNGQRVNAEKGRRMTLPEETEEAEQMSQFGDTGKEDWDGMVLDQ